MISIMARPRPVPCAAQTPLWKEPPLLLAGALFLLRILYLPWINLFPEEAYYWNYAQHLDIGYLDHPPMVAWLIALGTRIGGQTEFGVRLFALVCSAVTSFFAWQLAARLYGRRAGTVAALLTQILPFFFMAGWIMTPDAPLTACWAGTLSFLARAFFDRADRAPRAWLGAGVLLGLGLLSKYTVALLGPAAMLFLLLDAPSRGWWRRWEPYAAAALAVVIFSPVIGWNLAHHGASFAFQSTARLRAHVDFSLPALLGSALLMLTPIGVWLAARAWRRGGAATAVVIDEERRRWLFVWVFTLVPLAVFVVFSLTHRVKLNWTGPLWLALVPVLAAQITGEGRPAPEAGLRLACRVTAAALAVLSVGLLQYLSFGVPGLPYAGNIALLPVGWAQMGAELEREQAAVRPVGGERVLIVGMDRDFIASEAAFYYGGRPRGVAEVTGTHLFGSMSLMYAYWFPPAAQEGASLVLASFEREWLDSRAVQRHCATLEPIREHAVVVNGKPVCHYYTRVVLGYHSAAAASGRLPTPGVRVGIASPLP